MKKFTLWLVAAIVAVTLTGQSFAETPALAPVPMTPGRTVKQGVKMGKRQGVTMNKKAGVAMAKKAQ
jgi:hypothetical protein